MTGIRRLAWLTLVLGFGHVVFGAIVRITGSGMGCGDHWPKCHGYWFPPLSRPDLIIEVSHRYFAATLTLTVVSLVVWAWRRRETPGVGGRGGVLRAALLAAVIVVTAAVFGGFTVWLELENKLVIVTHLTLAMGLLGALVAAIVRAGGPPRLPIYRASPESLSSIQRTSQPSTASWRASPATARDAAISAALILTAVVLGGLTAHIPGANTACMSFPLCGDGLLPTHPIQHLQYVHRLVAFAAFFHVGWLGVALTRRDERRMAAAARVVLTLIFAQIIVAATMIAFRLPPLWRSLHEAVGTLLWIAVFAFAYIARRLAHPTPVTETTPDAVGRAAEVPA